MNKKERVLDAFNALMGIEEEVKFGSQLQPKTIHSIKNEIKYSDEVFEKYFHGKYRVDVSYQSDQNAYFYCINRKFLWFYYTLNYRDIFSIEEFNYITQYIQNVDLEEVVLFSSMLKIFNMIRIRYEN